MAWVWILDLFSFRSRRRHFFLFLFRKGCWCAIARNLIEVLLVSHWANSVYHLMELNLWVRFWVSISLVTQDSVIRNLVEFETRQGISELLEESRVNFGTLSCLLWWLLEQIWRILLIQWLSILRVSGVQCVLIWFCQRLLQIWWGCSAPFLRRLVLLDGNSDIFSEGWLSHARETHWHEE